MASEIPKDARRRQAQQDRLLSFSRVAIEGASSQITTSAASRIDFGVVDEATSPFDSVSVGTRGLVHYGQLHNLIWTDH